jgi:RHS repeat-associated protein
MPLRAQDDAGWKIEDDTQGPNHDRYGEYWTLITPDGTRYRFGYDAGSNWTEPVVSPKVGQPCHNGLGQPCTRTWRWNLDQEQDTNGNTISYGYTTETNHYRRTGTSDDAGYVRGGFLHDVTYGGSDGAPSDQAEFFYVPRCKELATGGDPGEDAKCPEIDKEHASSYPDVPMDLMCEKDCTEHSPSFFITSRLNYIQTQVWDGRTSDGMHPHWADVTRIQAGMRFPPKSPPASPDLWLESLQVTGEYHGTVQLPASVFSPVTLQNRVDYNSKDKDRLEFERLAKIQGELGTDTTVEYGHASDAAACPSGGEEAGGYQQWLAGKKWDDNTQECYRQFYSPQPGQPGQWGIFQKYVVKSVTTQDLLKFTDLEQTTYQYQGAPAWHFGEDPLVPDQYQSWNEWRGYGTVRTIYGDQQEDAPVQQQTITDTTFFRGMDGDRMASGPARKASVTDYAGNTFTDHDYLDGQPLQVRHWKDTGDGPLADVSSERYTYWAAETAHAGSLVPAWMVRPEGDWVRAPMLNGHTRTTWTVTDGYSTTGSGLPTRTVDYGDGSDPQCVTTGYAQNPARWLMDFPGTVDTHAGGPGDGDSCAGPTTARTVTLYDYSQVPGETPSKGNPTQVRVYTDPAHYSATATSYDPSGRVSEVMDPLGNKTITTFSPPTGIPFDAVTTVNALGQKTVTVPTLPFGTPYSVEDPNGNVTGTRYDAAGRLIQVLQPSLAGGQGDTTLTQTFQYKLTFKGTDRISEVPEVISSQLLDTQNQVDRWLTSYAYLDGYGRTRQTDTASPGLPGGRIVTVTSYDARGLTAATSLPFTDDEPAGSGIGYFAPDAIPSLTTTTYDAVQRPVQVNLVSDGKTRWFTGYRYAADVTILTPPSGGATATWTDGHGRTARIQQNYPVRRGAPPLNLATTHYAYNDAGQLASITGPAGSVTSYGYDWAGNKTSADDPDAGRSTYAYNAGGELTSQTDADGTVTSTTYDQLGRRTGLWDGNPDSGTQLAKWTYDNPSTANGTGQLAASTSYSDGGAYTDTVTGYDTRGDITGENIAIPASDGNLSTPDGYTYGYSYNQAGDPVSTTYPQAGGLDRETVTTSYNDQGLPTTLTSDAYPAPGYVTGTGYSYAGRLAGRTLGGTAPAPAVTRYYSWDNSTGRLAWLTTKTAGQDQVQDDVYSYDPAGDLLSDEDRTGGVWQCYGYDQFPRLTQAWTTTRAGGCEGGVRTYEPGTSAYQLSYSYGIAGNTTAVTSGLTTASKTITRYTYPAPGQARPHAPLTVGATSYAYDPDGNLTRQVTGRARQLYDWDPLGQLAMVTGYQPGRRGARVTSFAYDTSGNRLIRRDPDGTVTLYLPGMELDSDGTAVTGTRYYSIGGATVAARATSPGAPGLHWLTGSPQGSPEFQVSADGTGSSGRQKYLPYGALNGASTITATDRGFLGQPYDPSTGLIDDGARYYNPATGQFISPDPAISIGDPDSLNGYAYADDNPSSWTDPTGLCATALYRYCPGEPGTAPGKSPVNVAVPHGGCTADPTAQGCNGTIPVTIPITITSGGTHVTVGNPAVLIPYLPPAQEELYEQLIPGRGAPTLTQMWDALAAACAGPGGGTCPYDLENLALYAASYAQGQDQATRSAGSGGILGLLKTLAGVEGSVAFAAAGLPDLGVEAGAGLAAEDAGSAAAGDAGTDAEQYVYRVHGDQSGPWGHSWTPEDPLAMDNPRAELGLPKVNSGQFLTKASVEDMTGVTQRAALPLDGNPGGGPEWLFPDPQNQLSELWTIPIEPPF